MESRLDRERTFHNELLLEEEGRSANRFYSVNKASWDCYAGLLLEACERVSAQQPAKILEYGCGGGAYSTWLLAQRGYPMIGVDLSDVAIERLRAQAARELPAADVRFDVMNAEALEFGDDAFHVLCGNGILHHLDTATALEEVARVLRSDGRALFTEPLGHNPLINLYRSRTRDQRTHDEHPLLVSDLDLAGRYFGHVEVRYYHLLDLLAVPLRNARRFEQIRTALSRLDRALFKAIPALERFAWQAVIVLSEPKRPARAQ